MVKPKIVGGLSPFWSVAGSEWSGAVTYEASGETMAAIRAARRREADIAMSQPQPSQLAALVAQPARDTWLGRLKTIGVPVTGFDGWDNSPVVATTEPTYDLTAPLRDMQERIRAHTIEQARLDEIGRLKARAEVESAKSWPLVQQGGAAGQPEFGRGPHLASEHQDKSAPGEAPKTRQDRRLSRLRAIGGDFVPHGNGWRANGTRGALAQLIREEGSSGAPMSDKTNIREDLAAAVTREAGNL